MRNGEVARDLNLEEGIDLLKKNMVLQLLVILSFYSR